MSRSSVWRILEAVDLKPHQSAYGLQSHDADLEAKAHPMCPLYVGALATYA
jgi:hypothetical protein